MKVQVHLSEKERERLERLEKLREEHKRACLICGTTVIVLGAVIGLAGFHGIGMVVEATGLYMVALV